MSKDVNRLETDIHHYRGEAIDVSYDVKRCIHAAECVRGLPTVFDTAKRPWVNPDDEPADAVAEVIMRCPTGSLQFERKDGGPAEPTPARNVVAVAADGPLYVRGDVQIQDETGAVLLADTRLALCRCGASEHKPFCDNAHRRVGFEDGGEIDGGEAGSLGETAVHGVLEIIPEQGGPLLLFGDFELVSADGEVVFRGRRASLCRCGASDRKPFCDNSHEQIGFESGKM